MSFLLMRGSLVGAWMVAGHQKDRAMIGAGGFQPHLAVLWEVQGPGNGINNQLRLHDVASMKVPIVPGLGSFWVGEHIYLLRWWWPCIFLHMAVHS